MTAETHGERLSALETWVSGHERLCAERYDSLRGDLRWILRGIVGLLLGVCGWLAVQLWNGAGRAVVTDAESTADHTWPIAPATRGRSDSESVARRAAQSGTKEELMVESALLLMLRAHLQGDEGGNRGWA